MGAWMEERTDGWIYGWMVLRKERSSDRQIAIIIIIIIIIIITIIIIIILGGWSVDLEAKIKD